MMYNANIISENPDVQTLGKLQQYLQALGVRAQVVSSDSDLQGIRTCYIVAQSFSFAIRMEGYIKAKNPRTSIRVISCPEQRILMRSMLLPTTRVSDSAQIDFSTECCEPTCAYGKPEKISRREREVLGLWVNGYTNKEIAWKLGISQGTLAAHRRNLYRKTGLNSMSQLVVWALIQGIATTK